MKLVECVPNFSEGRRKEIIDSIVSQAKSRNVSVLDVESDPDHNRSVLTFVGSPEAVKDAALAVSEKAIELIDLTKHTGQHPRIGAVDVVPFIPISDLSIEECVTLAKQFAEEFAAKFKVPVFLYEAAATRPDRRNLADVRKGEFEELREQIGKNPDRSPDYGPNAIHPTAGATAIGARQILIAYNINLATNNLTLARDIARQVRASNGGLAAVKALGFELKERGIVQVSMNMVDYKASQLFKAFELVKTLAHHHGVQVLSSEIVGLAPMDALTETAQFYLQLQGFEPNQILERRLAQSQANNLISQNLASFADQAASEKPVPGGGSVSAYVGALAAGLVSMVSRLTLKREEYKESWSDTEKILEASTNHRKTLLLLVDQDSTAFSCLMEAYKLPRSTDSERQARTLEIQNRLKEAAEVPMKTAEAAAGTLSLSKELSPFANSNALSDLQTATHLAFGSAMGALANVEINLAGVRDADYSKALRIKVDGLTRQIELDKTRALEILKSRRKSA